jgi:tetratricopeptide (TPR) repeat protein
MNFLKKLFAARTPEEHLGKGDSHFAAGSYYEARISYEAGLEACRGDENRGDLFRNLESRLAKTGRAMAELNLHEAEHAIQTGATAKAVEYLELAKTLTDDAEIREKADCLLAGLSDKSNNTQVLAPAASCTSCTHGSPDEQAEQDVTPVVDPDLSLTEHYGLLIHQLPPEMYDRYASLGEEFAYMFVAASGDSHEKALELLETWDCTSNRDIYCYEKGKILHRLGRNIESENSFKQAIRENDSNPLAHLGLAQLLLEDNRLAEAAEQLDRMISGEILAGQALMMRGEVYEFSGETDAAINLYGSLLTTSLARAAAEKLYGLLVESNRQQEADHVFKRYLGKCQH